MCTLYITFCDDVSRTVNGVPFVNNHKLSKNRDRVWNIAGEDDNSARPEPERPAS